MNKDIRIIGRREEMEVLTSCYESGKPEMVIVYGRRRVGKTHLVKRMFGDEFAFYMTGIYRAPKKRQLANFAYSLSEFSGNDEAVPETWTEAFRRLKEYLKKPDNAGTQGGVHRRAALARHAEKRHAGGSRPVLERMGEQQRRADADTLRQCDVMDD